MCTTMMMRKRRRERARERELARKTNVEGVKGFSRNQLGCGFEVLVGAGSRRSSWLGVH